MQIEAYGYVQSLIDEGFTTEHSHLHSTPRSFFLTKGDSGVDVYHFEDGTALYYHRLAYDGNLIKKTSHRLDGPAERIFNTEGRLLSERYFCDGRVHRSAEVGPAIIHYDSDGIAFDEYFVEHSVVLMAKRYGKPRDIHQREAICRLI